jgi:chromosome segregation ATPase
MNKYITLTLVFAFLFGINITNTFAEDDGTNREDIKNIRQEIKNTVKENRETIKEERKENREQIKTQREEAKNKLEALRENLKSEKDKAKSKIQEQRINNRIEALARFDKMVETISKNKERVSEQISKVKTLGIDTSGAEEELAKIDPKLEEVKNKITEMNTLLAKSANQLTQADKANLKTLTKQAQDGIKQAHQYIKNSVRILKEIAKTKRAEQNPSTSSAPTSSEVAQ